MSRDKEIYKLFEKAKIARNDSLYVRETEEEIVQWQREMDQLNRDTNTVDGCYNRVLDEFEMRIRAYKNGYTENVSDVVIGMIPLNVLIEVEAIFKSQEMFKTHLGESLKICLCITTQI